MKNKGISLIVLIITIVVIIILATAIIVNIANTNLIENANEAVVKQDIKAFQDELTLYIADKYVDMQGKFKAEDLDVNTKIDEIIPSIKGTKYEGYIVIEDGKLAVLETMPEPQKTWAMETLGLKEALDETTQTSNVALDNTNGTKNESITGGDFVYNNPVIPVGFKAVNTEKAAWDDKNNDGIVDGWNNGLVLMDSNDNEYVWIPVDETNVKYEKWNGSKNTDYTVTKEQVEDDTLPSGVDSETTQITKYGGFYVARYEAGLPDSQTTEELMLTKTFSADDNNRKDIGNAQSKADKIVWNQISYINAKAVSEIVVSSNYVQSGLVTGTQWDTMLTFLSKEVGVDTNCVSWGNYSDKCGYTINGYYRAEHADVVYVKGEYTKLSEGYLLLQTGKFGSVVSEGNPKNLFDVSGNVWEWNTETVTEKGGQHTEVGYKIVRGGGYYNTGDSYVASSRNGIVSEISTGPSIGFRFALFIK